ncbi:hypothetical protein NM688_g493 [Phlebia brevispora]|uniref:Uncharacterized protein n=1 Tax=Phlebia brevispora TaxID=194682 RepID=A0ACC1TE14_9APHY|nr:hypothetical protein NM688_g493 [Phlebia brevispora]
MARMPHSLAVSQTRQVQSKVAPEEEVVEDSEPEREEQRQYEKAKRRERRSQNPSGKSPEVIDFIELSDDSHPEHVPIRTTPAPIEPRSIIVISDDSDDSLFATTTKRDVAKGHEGPRSPKSSRTCSFDDSSILPDIRDILGLPSKPTTQVTNVVDALPSQETVESPPKTQTTLGLSTQISQLTEIRVSAEPEAGSEDSGSAEEHRRPFSLARFAYVPSRPSRTPSVSRLPSRSVSTSSVGPSRSASVLSISPEVVSGTAIAEPMKQPAKRGRKPRTPSQAFASVSERDMVQLLRCVACNLAWTTRKTAAQKVKHIQSCAHKAGLTDETVGMLIKEELEKTPAVKPVKNKGKSKAKEEEPMTLLAEKINDETGKRKRRAPVEGTVREIAEIREDILERARQLLNGGTRPTSVLRERDDGRPEQGDIDAAPPLTQPFGESALARRFQAARALLSQNATQVRVPSSTQDCGDQDAESPPRTQPFGESALARQFGAPSHLISDQEQPALHNPHADTHINASWLDASDEEDDAYGFRVFPVSVSPTSEHSVLIGTNANDSLNARIPPFHSSSSPNPVNNAFVRQGEILEAETGTLHYAPDLQTAAADNYMFEDDYDQWRDDAMLHYEPDLEQTLPNCLAEDMPSKKAKTTATRTKRKSRSKLSRPQIVLESETEEPATTQAKSKSQGKTKKVLLTEEEIHAHLREGILADTKLYMRILRYEPLPLDLFVQLVVSAFPEETIKVTGPLKLQIRAYLDQQAIQSYDHEQNKPRTKKRRR